GYGFGFLAVAAAAYAAWDGVRRRNLLVGFLIFVVAVQISLSHGFLAGRSAFAFRYLAPAFPALCMLVGIGAYALVSHFRLPELTLVGAAAALLIGALVSFPKANSRERH